MAGSPVAGEELAAKGITVIPIDLRRGGKNILHEINIFRQLVGVYRRVRPDIVHHVAMKPVLYGSLAAKMAGGPAVVNALAGMGYLFTSQDLQARILRPPVRAALKQMLSGGLSRVIVQNPRIWTFCAMTWA